MTDGRSSRISLQACSTGVRVDRKRCEKRPSVEVNHQGQVMMNSVASFEPSWPALWKKFCRAICRFSKCTPFSLTARYTKRPEEPELVVMNSTSCSLLTDLS